MPAGPDFLLLAALGAAGAAAVLVLAVCIRGAVWLLWAACLVPLFLLGRTYATLGVSPVFLPDALAMLATVATVATMGVWARHGFSEERLRAFRNVALLLAAVTALAVCRGVAAGYPDPLKGAILGLYPLLGWVTATWLLTRPASELTRWRRIVYVPATGVLLCAALGIGVTPVAFGLYLAIVGAFSVQLRRLGDSRPLLWTLAGTAAVTAIGSKRGVLLAVVAAVVASSVAGRSSRGRVTRVPVLWWALATAAIAGLLALSVSDQRLSTAPVVGGLVSRVESSAEDPDSESANNVDVRFAMWRQALEAVGEHAVIGVGAGHPLDVVFEGRRLQEPKSGPHNSFVGYIYYLGWPAGIAMLAITAATLRRTWRARRHPAAASWFGATVGVCVTAFTNVAFETTFIGLPSWLVLACAYGLVGVPRGEETAAPRRTGERQSPQPRRHAAPHRVLVQ